MRVIIFGGSGLIGRALAENLLADKHDVIILSRNPRKVKAMPIGAKIVAWDGETAKGWGELVEGAHAIVNLAGASIAGENPFKMRWTKERKSAILQSRINAGRAITEAIKSAQHKPDILIQASAVGFYGPLGDENVDEKTPGGFDFLADVCEQWETSTKDIEALGVRRAVIRTGLVFSSKGGVFPLLGLPFKFFIGGTLGNGKQYLSWIHINDVVTAIRFLIESGKSHGVYNLSAPHPITNRIFGKTLGSVMRRPSYFPVPALAMKLALGEASTLALDGQRVLPKRLEDAGFSFEFPNLEGALADLLRRNLRFTHRFRVNASLEAASDFHRNTEVLKQLTPLPILVQFHKVEPVGEGSSADFTLWLGPFPIPWSAKHYDFDPPRGFKDIQLKGPFTFWDHHHAFIQIDDQTTEVVDDITAQLGRHFYYGLVSRFMWLTLPILFSYRAWQTRRLVEKYSHEIIDELN
ncbi:MAG: TIGR01777 family oxidoreductase [Anaerolineales bacterium]|nr:TIGR01777 family oxidoreductase [Anaerolineales bacterium]